MTPLPTISPNPHTCDLCGETIFFDHHGQIPGGNARYRVHSACEDLWAAGVDLSTDAKTVFGRIPVFKRHIATLSPSDLCEILQAHSADEIVRLCNLRQRLTETTP